MPPEPSLQALGPGPASRGPTSPERFARVRDLFTPGLLLALGVGFVAAMPEEAWRASPGGFLIGAIAALLLVPGVAALVLPPGALVLEGEGVGYRVGPNLTGERPWRARWTEVAEIRVVREGGGETLVVQTSGGRTAGGERRVALRPFLAPRPLRDRDGLLAALARAGHPATLPVEFAPVGEAFPLLEGKGGRSARRIFLCLQVGGNLALALQALSHLPRADAWGTAAVWTLLGVLQFIALLAAFDFRREIVVAEGGVLLRRVSGRLRTGMRRPLARLRGREAPAPERTVWALGWGELTGVRLGPLRYQGEVLAMEFASPGATHRLAVESSETVLEGRERLVALLAERGFPVERAAFETLALPG